MSSIQTHRSDDKKRRQRRSVATHVDHNESAPSRDLIEPKWSDATISRATKRGIDVVLAAATGLLLLPLLIVIAAAIKCVSRGPVLYSQLRLGRHGKPFRVLKFRTMTKDAEHRLGEYLENDLDYRQQWHNGFKVKNDPRVIPWIGPLLRTTSLDELPQLWNVLAGQMSLVGPRPLPGYHHDQLSEDFQRSRESMPPGITGQWQVSARRDGNPETIRKWDTFYLENWSLLLDLKILALTPWSLLVETLSSLPDIREASLLGNRDRDPHA